MGLSHGCRVLSDSEIEVYMVCEKGASDQQKLKSSVYIEGVWGQSPQENFVDTLFTLAENNSTNYILACAALELLITMQQLFK